MGVGDIDEVLDWTWCGANTPHDHNHGREGCEYDASLDNGRGPQQFSASYERRRKHWLGIGDGARTEHGAGIIYRQGSRGADGVRGDGVGVGDVGEMLDDAWCTWHTAGSDYGWKDRC